MKKLNRDQAIKKVEFYEVVEVCLRCEQAEVFDEGLCEHCYDKINNNEIIGYRKGE